MKKMIKLVAGAVTFGVLSGSVFTGTSNLMDAMLHLCVFSLKIVLLCGFSWILP